MQPPPPHDPNRDTDTCVVPVLPPAQADAGNATSYQIVDTLANRTEGGCVPTTLYFVIHLEVSTSFGGMPYRLW